MLRNVFKPKGSRAYRGRYRVAGTRKIIDLPLDTPKKHIAEARLKKIHEEHEMEVVGMLPERAFRETADASPLDLLKDFHADRIATGCTENYANKTRTRITKLATECAWRRISDIKPDSFLAWRTKQTRLPKPLAPKTLNHYLGSVGGFLNWLVDNGKLTSNPLAKVKEADNRAKENEEKRAFTEDELHRLCSLGNERSFYYLLLAMTGMRKRESKLLAWDDTRLDGDKPSILLDPKKVKNRKLAEIPLLPHIAERLRCMRPESVAGEVKVFPGGVPKMETLHKHLELAGIPVTDSMGRKAGFHTFRRTFDTLLNLHGASPTGAMHLMRQNSTTLATHKYMDATQVQRHEEIKRIAGVEASLIASLKSDHKGKTLGKSDHVWESDPRRDLTEKPVNVSENAVFQVKSKNEKWRREGDSNPRYPYEYGDLANRCLRPLSHLSRRCVHCSKRMDC